MMNVKLKEAKYLKEIQIMDPWTGLYERYIVMVVVQWQVALLSVKLRALLNIVHAFLT